MGALEILLLSGACLCLPGVTIAITLAIVAALNRRRMQQDSANEWLRW